MKNHPKFRIQAVAEKTGVPAATLRAWERRYGVPQPVRTDTAYRVYSEQDIADIERLRDLCDRGMSVSQAALALRSTPKVNLTLRPAPVPAPDRTAYAQARQRFLDALGRMALTDMAATLGPAALLGPPEEVYEQLLVPIMIEVGDLWHEGKLSIGHEHLATEMVTGAARQLLQLSQPSQPQRTCILACFADELHAMPLYGIGFKLGSLGCRSAVLGQRTPPSGLAPAVRELKPAIVCLSATVVPERSRTVELLEGYARACGTTPWIVGGAATPEIAHWVLEAGGHVSENEPDKLGRQLASILEER